MDAQTGSTYARPAAHLAEGTPLLTSLAVRDFRSYANTELELGAGLTVIFGPNAAGKTNLLEALYFGCTGRSPRASNEREVVRFGTRSTRVVVGVGCSDGAHELAVGFVPGEPKRLTVDGASVDTLIDVTVRPRLIVFLPDRLELVKGPPAVRRAHVDQLVAALWPARVGTRRAYAQALAQRNALVARIRARGSSLDALSTWDMQLARHGIALMADRAAAVKALAADAAQLASELSLGSEFVVTYRPRSKARSESELGAELAARVESDLERGFTGHGPHRDELLLLLGGRDLRVYGSQGQQRLGLLALLLAEREAIARSRASLPVLLLDDVMSELDQDRRQALVRRMQDAGGQAVVTATELDHVPAAERGARAFSVSPGGAVSEASLSRGAG